MRTWRKLLYRTHPTIPADEESRGLDGNVHTLQDYSQLSTFLAQIWVAELAQGERLEGHHHLMYFA
ncbi:hypothetical protein EJB05_55180 [Eragrostis curvula]|uniref:Uncharacterized protein n=1 Tax=Eragrostis curvula TaxID=38414 RepID=A0A5J9SKD0_9POAL|nr:hypothetical protein EJB05_55180 [Eragrostis curvula]